MIQAIVRGAARLLDIGATLDRGSDISYQQAAYNSFRRAWCMLGDDLRRTIDKEGRLYTGPRSEAAPPLTLDKL